MPLEHAHRERLDGGAIADVAELDLGADLAGERPEPVLAAGDEHAVPARRRERACGRLADARRCSRDDGDALHPSNVTQMGPPDAR